jgi:hypothetical protein
LGILHVKLPRLDKAVIVNVELGEDVEPEKSHFPFLLYSTNFNALAVSGGK